MISGTLNIAKAQAMQANEARASARIGIVTAYDPVNHCSKVNIQPEGIETGWLPILVAWGGNGWGLFCPPAIGSQVEVHFQEGDFESGFIGATFCHDSSRPLTVPLGEYWLVHASGQYVKLLNDGTIQSNGTWNHAGDVNITGTLTATTDVIGGGKHLKTHVHNGVQTGSGNTGQPV